MTEIDRDPDFYDDGEFGVCDINADWDTFIIIEEANTDDEF